jgi:outer membrane receptor for ferrienterochelin and colicins
MLGGTYLDAFNMKDNGEKEVPLKTERFTGTWTLSYKIKKAHLGIDYTGNVYSPMRLPLISDLDPRREYSPWWSIQNIQLVYSGFKNIEMYGGVKNLLNWTPSQGNPFIIARTNDPFNNDITKENDKVIATPNNPQALSFDADYNYAPNQGIRGFFGVRLAIK